VSGRWAPASPQSTNHEPTVGVMNRNLLATLYRLAGFAALAVAAAHAVGVRNANW